MKQHFVRKLINTSLCMAGITQGVSLYATPPGQKVGLLSNGTPVYEGVKGFFSHKGFYTSSGNKVRKINDIWCEEKCLKGNSSKITLWADIKKSPENPALYDDQDRQLSHAGYHRETHNPVYFHPARNLYLVWPDRMSTKQELISSVIFNDDPNSIELSVHQNPVGYFYNGMPVYEDDKREFCTINGTAVKKINDEWCEEKRFMSKSGQRSLWFHTSLCQSLVLYNDQDRSLPLVGYHLLTHAPVFLYEDGTYILWSDTMTTLYNVDCFDLL
ncbi:MAG: hypothetical protein LBJ78_00260 [Puniceicoccales bacterium]|nr:hypothetical protein [Puniceicoccales bacterium]